VRRRAAGPCSATCRATARRLQDGRTAPGSGLGRGGSGPAASGWMCRPRRRVVRALVRSPRYRPPLDAGYRAADDPALAQAPRRSPCARRTAPVDGVGGLLVRPRCRQFCQDFRQSRVVDRGDGEVGRLRTPASTPAHVVSEKRAGQRPAGCDGPGDRTADRWPAESGIRAGVTPDR
jgi:hypothetical protein